MTFQDKLTQFLLDNGATDVGFAHIDEAGFGECRYAVSIVVKLSEAIIDEINEGPTHTYFHHYRTVNAFIDQLLLKAGLFLDKAGYKYIPVAASQSINDKGWNYAGRYSHKKVACFAGLGSIGKNTLFLHNLYGAQVRLGTIFTDCAFETEVHVPVSPCKDCNLCVVACPANAITGREWSIEQDDDVYLLPEKCSEYMKKNFNKIGRGAVCGICIAVCPRSKK